MMSVSEHGQQMVFNEVLEINVLFSAISFVQLLLGPWNKWIVLKNALFITFVCNLFIQPHSALSPKTESLHVDCIGVVLFKQR